MSIQLIAQDFWRFQLSTTKPNTLTFDFTWANNLSPLEPSPSLGGIFRGLQSAPLDCDLAVLLLNNQAKLPEATALISFANPCNPSKSVQHLSDNLTGTSNLNQHERIKISFDTLPTWVDSLIFVVSIYEAEKRHQNFAQLQKACLIVSPTPTEPWLSFCLPQLDTSVKFLALLKLERQQNSWLIQTLLEPLPATNLQDIYRTYAAYPI